MAKKLEKKRWCGYCRTYRYPWLNSNGPVCQVCNRLLAGQKLKNQNTRKQEKP